MRPPRPPGDPQIGRRSRATRSSPSSHTGERAVDDRLAVQERRRGARVAEQDAPGDPRSRRAGAAHRRGCWWGAAVESCHERAPPPARQRVAVGDLPRRRQGRDRCRVFTRLSGRVPPRVSVPASRARRRVRAENGEEELRMSVRQRGASGSGGLCGVGARRGHEKRRVHRPRRTRWIWSGVSHRQPRSHCCHARG